MTDMTITDTDEPLEGTETIEVRLEREELYQLMLYAHEQDITLNQLVEQILIDFIEQDKASIK